MKPIKFQLLALGMSVTPLNVENGKIKIDTISIYELYGRLFIDNLNNTNALFEINLGIPNDTIWANLSR